MSKAITNENWIKILKLKLKLKIY